MSMSKTLDVLTRITKLIACFAVAVYVIVRANKFSDPMCVSPLPAMMCGTFAVVMVFTGLALASSSRE